MLSFFLFVSITPYLSAQIDCTGHDIDVVINSSSCSATFTPIIPNGLNPDIIIWELYNSHSLLCDGSFDYNWTKDFCFDDNYEIKMTASYNNGTEVCVVYKTVNITCTTFNCLPNSTPTIPVPQFRYLYIDPGCYGTTYYIETEGDATDLGCNLVQYTIDYIEPEFVLINPCPGPGADIPKSITFSPGGSACIWAKHGTGVTISVTVDQTCCNQAFCFSGGFYSTDQNPHGCPGVLCGWPIDDLEKCTAPNTPMGCCTGDIPDWQSLFLCPGFNISNGKNNESTNQTAVNSQDKQSDNSLTIKRLTIHDLQGTEIYRNDHAQTYIINDDVLKSSYRDQMVLGLNIIRIFYSDGTVKIIKVMNF